MTDYYRVDPSQVEKAAQGYSMKGQPGVQVSSRAFKMSKSRGNVVNPDDVVFSFGADSLRLYEMFMGPLRETKVRQNLSMQGGFRIGLCLRSNFEQSP